VLRSVGEILRAKRAVLKRGAKSPKVSQTPENTGAPETVRRHYSTVTEYLPLWSHATLGNFS